MQGAHGKPHSAVRPIQAQSCQLSIALGTHGARQPMGPDSSSHHSEPPARPEKHATRCIDWPKAIHPVPGVQPQGIAPPTSLSHW